MIPSTYVRLSIFLSAILIPVWAVSSLAFPMMYSACKLNQQSDNIQPCCTPLPILNQFIVPCPVLLASWPTYKFLRRQVRWPGIPMSLRIFHNLLWSTQRILLCQQGRIQFFLEFPCFFYDPTNVGNLISGSSAFSKSSMNIWNFMVHLLLKPSLKDFEHILASMGNECNWMVIWTFYGIALLWDWNENWPFPVLWPLLSFPNLLAYWVQHFHSIIF